MTTTPRLNINYVQEAQASKHVTINEAFDKLTAAAQISVVNTTTTTPPGAPATGAQYVIAATATGVWAGRENQIATRAAAGWIYMTPTNGWRIWDQTEGVPKRFNGTAWIFDTATLSTLEGVRVAGTVIDSQLTTPPGGPSNGDAYIVPASATGAWSGEDTKLAIWADGAWVFHAPAEGWAFYDQTNNVNLQWDGAAWNPYAGGQNIAVDDEGVETVASLARLNFTGAGVSVTDNGSGEAEVVIPGSSGAAVNAQTGTTYTLALTDANDVITMNNASANTLTIPTNASVALAVGTIISVIQIGAGATTVEGAVGVTVNGVSAGSATLTAQHSAVSLVKIATDTWNLAGDHGGVS